MWVNSFVTGWVSLGNVVAMCLGGLAAIVLGLFILVAAGLILFGILSAVFNVVTDKMAKRWEKTGRQPAHRWAEIIARGRNRGKQ